MGVMIVTTLVVAVLTLIGTVVWWAMMNAWVEKDRRSRGRHLTDAPPSRADDRERGGAAGDAEAGDGPVVMKL